MISLKETQAERLTPNDRAEVEDFISKANQYQELYQQSHQMSVMCWKKCALNAKNSQLDKKEVACLRNCVERFIDVHNLILQKAAAILPQPSKE